MCPKEGKKLIKNKNKNYKVKYLIRTHVVFFLIFGLSNP